MKWWAVLMTVFFTNTLLAQKQSANSGAIDWYVQFVHDQNPDSLSTKLTATYRTDLEKVRAIYSWICQNIKYNTDIFKPRALRAKYVPEPEDTSQWVSGDEMVAKKVLRRGVAVCDGYSRLFKVLCQYAGVEAVVVNGYARTDIGPSRDYFKTNHTWNAVRIDSTWQLVDATWGAGYVTYNDEFVQKQNDYYFLTPPGDMIRDHFPEELRWTLLTALPSIGEFKKAPFKSKFFVKYGINSYSPSQGWMQAGTGDTLHFSISVKDLKKAKSVFPDPFFDSSSITLSPASVFLQPKEENSSTVTYQFVVDENTQWVNLLFNDDVVLRYCISRRQLTVSN